MRGRLRRSPSRHWPSALAWTLATIAAVLVRSLYVIPALWGSDWWAVAWDAWAGTDSAAQFLAGHPLRVYEGPRPFVYMPLYAVLMVPPYLVARAFDLLMDHPIGTFHPRPGGWPVLLAWGAAWSAVPYTAALRLAERVRLPRHFLMAAVAACVVWPTLTWGHFEDLIIVGLLSWSVVLVAERGGASSRAWTGAALLLAAAGAIKQTAWLYVPLLAMWAPRHLRLRVALVAVSLPALLMIAMLVATPEARLGVFPVPKWPGYGVAAPWVTVPELARGALDPITIDTRSRFLAVPIALAAAWMVRRRTDIAALLAGAVVVSAGRVLCEAVQWPYYAAALFWFASCLLIVCRAWRAAVLLGLYAIVISELYPPPSWLATVLPAQSRWWWIAGSLVAVLCMGAALYQLRTDPARDGR